MNSKKFTLENVTEIYEVICSNEPLALTQALEVEKFIENSINEGLISLQQIWEWFRLSYNHKIVEAVDYVIPMWNMRAMAAKEERELIQNLSVICLLSIYHDKIKDLWSSMSENQKHSFLINLIGPYS